MRSTWFARDVSEHRTNAVVGVVGSALRNAFVVPVQRGRIRMGQWPRAASGVVVAAYVVYGLLVLSVLLSVPLARLAPETEPFGLRVIGSLAVAFGVWAAMVLLFLAALHLPFWWRPLAWLLLLVPHGIGWVVSLLTILTQGELWRALLVVMAVLIGVVLLVVLVATATGRPASVWSAVCTAIGFGLTYSLPQLVAGPFTPLVASGVAVVAFVLTVIALPLAVAAGTAFAQFAVNLTSSTMVSIRDRAPGRIWPVVAILAAVAVMVIGVWRALGAEPGTLAITVVHTVLCVGLAGLALWAIRGRILPADDPPRPAALTETLGNVSMALGLALGSWALPQLLSSVLALPPLITEHITVWADLLMALVAVVLLVRGVRRRNLVTVVLLPSVIVMAVFAAVQTQLGWPSVSATIAAMVLALVVIGAVVRWRSRMTTHRWFVVSLALVVLVVFPYRQEITEPLEAVLGSTQVAVLLIGLIWMLLTEAEFTHESSPRHSRVARVLVFLAYAVFSAAMATSLAFAVGDSMLIKMNMGDLADIGDAIIGYAFAPAVVIGLLLIGHHEQDVADPSTPPVG